MQNVIPARQMRKMGQIARLTRDGIGIKVGRNKKRK